MHCQHHVAIRISRDSLFERVEQAHEMSATVSSRPSEGNPCETITTVAFARRASRDFWKLIQGSNQGHNPGISLDRSLFGFDLHFSMLHHRHSSTPGRCA
jgi:hypothetical protein